MKPLAKDNRVQKNTGKLETIPTTLNLSFPGRSALVPRKQRELEKGLRQEVVKTIDEAFGQD